MQRSERPVRIARSNASVTARTCPSPCPASGSRQSRRYSPCASGSATPMGVKNRHSTRTKASISFVLRSLGIRRTGILGWRMPIVSGSRVGLACPNARINGLVATDLETLVSEVIDSFPSNAGFANGLFVMTTATDHKNNLNR